MLMASGAGSGVGDAGRSDSRRHHTARGRGEEIHVRPRGGPRKANILGEPIGHFRLPLRSSRDRSRDRTDTRNRAGWRKWATAVLEDSRGEPAPPRVHESDPGIGGGQEDGQAVGDAHGETRGRGTSLTTPSQAAREAAASARRTDGAMNLIEPHRGAAVQEDRARPASASVRPRRTPRRPPEGERTGERRRRLSKLQCQLMAGEHSKVAKGWSARRDPAVWAIFVARPGPAARLPDRSAAHPVLQRSPDGCALP